MKFSGSTWENMPHTKNEELTETAQIFFHLLQQFTKLKKTSNINILIFEKPVQDFTSSNCGIFQLYVYKNLFDPDEKSKIINHENLNKQTTEIIFNEIFSTDLNENEYLIKKFKYKYNL